jgi:hypothetical protein
MKDLMVHISVKLLHIRSTKSSISSHLPFMGAIEATMLVCVAYCFFYSLLFGLIYYTNISACASLNDSQVANLLYCSWFGRRSVSLTYLLDHVPFTPLCRSVDICICIYLLVYGAGARYMGNELGRFLSASPFVVVPYSVDRCFPVTPNGSYIMQAGGRVSVQQMQNLKSVC